MESVNAYLERCVKIGGSDLHFKVDTGKAYIRINGDLHEVEAERFSHEDFETELYKIHSNHQNERIHRDHELDFAY